MKTLVGLLVVAICNGAVYQRSSQPANVKETILEVEPVGHIVKLLDKVFHDDQDLIQSERNSFQAPRTDERDVPRERNGQTKQKQYQPEVEEPEQGQIYIGLQQRDKIQINDQHLPTQNENTRQTQQFDKIRTNDQHLPTQNKNTKQTQKMNIQDPVKLFNDMPRYSQEKYTQFNQKSPVYSKPIQDIYQKLQTSNEQVNKPYQWDRVEVDPNAQVSSKDQTFRHEMGQQNRYEPYYLLQGPSSKQQQQQQQQQQQTSDKQNSKTEANIDRLKLPRQQIYKLEQQFEQQRKPFEGEQSGQKQYVFTQPQKRNQYEEPQRELSEIMYDHEKPENEQVLREETMLQRTHEVDKIQNEQKKVHDDLDMLKDKRQDQVQNMVHKLQRQDQVQKTVQKMQKEFKHRMQDEKSVLRTPSQNGERYTRTDKIPSDLQSMMDQLTTESKYGREDKMGRIYEGISDRKDMSRLFPAGQAILAMMLEQYRWYQPLELKNIKDFTGLNKTYLRSIVEELPEVEKTVNEPASLTVLYTKAVVEEVMNQRLKCPSTVLVKILTRQAKRKLVSLMQRYQMLSYNFLKRSLAEIMDENQAEELAKVGVEETDSDVFYNVMHYIVSNHVGDVEHLSQKLFGDLFKFFTKRQESKQKQNPQQNGDQQKKEHQTEVDSQSNGQSKEQNQQDKLPEDQKTRQQSDRHQNSEQKVQQPNSNERKTEKQENGRQISDVQKQEFDELLKIIEKASTHCNVKCPVGTDLETVNQFVLWDVINQFVPKSAMVLASRLEQMLFRRIFFAFAARGRQLPMEIYRYITDRVHPALFDIVQLYYKNAVSVIKDYERVVIPRYVPSYMLFIQHDVDPKERQVVETVLKTLGWKFDQEQSQSSKEAKTV